MPNNNYQQYSWFRMKKEELSNLLNESSGVINDLSMPQFASKLKQLGQKVANDSFKIQIVGTFKNGKSTFINALLGEDILPTRALPCTAVVNEVKYGEEKHARLHFRNPLPKKLLDCIPEPTLAHMQRHGMNDVPPMEIAYDHIDQYVTIPIDGDPEEISAMSPYQVIELFYPSPLLKEGVEIVDSPGLNEADERTRVTMEYLDKADAIIYLLDATKPCARDEMDTIEEVLIPKGFNDMFFVANRYDIIAERERPEVKRFIEQKVGKYSNNAVYCISALQGLDGKVRHDDALYQQSGMELFEKRLTEFLTKDKGRIKLAQPARELNSILSKEALYKAIPGQRQQLSTSLDTLKARYATVKPQLTDLEQQKQQMYSQMILRIERSQSEVRRAVLAEFREVSNHVPVWLNEFTPSSKLGWATKSKLKAAADEMVAHVGEKAKEHFGLWNKQVLSPLIEEKAKQIFESSDQDLNAIFKAIDDINAQITGQSVEAQGASGWERLAGFATFMLAGVGTGTYIMVNGFKGKDVIKSFALDMGVGVGLALLSITNPILGIAAAVALVWNAFGKGQDKALAALREKVGTAICDHVAGTAGEKADQVVERMRVELTKVADTAVGAIDQQIADLKSQVETAIKELEKGQANVNRRNELLNQSEQKLHTICGKLDTIVFELAGLSA